MAPLASVPNLATRWRHWHWLQIWPTDGTTWINFKFSLQVESLALPHCNAMQCNAMPWIALLALSVSIELVISSARVTSVRSAKGLSVCEWERTGPIDRTPGTPGSDKNCDTGEPYSKISPLCNDGDGEMFYYGYEAGQRLLLQYSCKCSFWSHPSIMQMMRESVQWRQRSVQIQ